MRFFFIFLLCVCVCVGGGGWGGVGKDQSPRLSPVIMMFLFNRCDMCC